VADRRGNDGDRARSKTGRFEQFAGYFTLEDIDLANYAGRSVPMDVVLGRERTKASQVVKQADVVALLALLPEEFASGTEEDNFRYYEPRCGHGSSLSPAMHGVVAARLGDVEMALRYFRQAAAIDLADTHAAIDGGVHIAGLGGIWMLAIFGFAGLSLQNDGVAVDPHLPAAWRSLAFRVQWRQRCLRIRIGQHEQLLEATLESGEPMTLVVRSERYELRQNLALRVFTGDDSPRSFSPA
jgi:trehalose/maltose hydrolase-like predicted phosphorylase